jgi:hypothetical protein
MADQVSVKANPIQRNRLDVAMELTELHTRLYGALEEDIEKVFAKYHALVCYCEKNAYGLNQLISEEVKVAEKRTSSW